MLNGLDNTSVQIFDQFEKGRALADIATDFEVTVNQVKKLKRLYNGIQKTRLSFLAVLTALIETATEGKTNSDRIYQHTLALRNNWLNLKTRKSNDDAAIILGTTSRLKLDYKCLTEITSSKGYYRIHLERAEETLANLEDELIEAFDFEFNADFDVQDLEKDDLSNVSYTIYEDCILTPKILSQLALSAYDAYAIFND